MSNLYYIVLFYLTFLIDFVVFSIPSEGSTLTLLKIKEQPVQKLLILGTYVLNLSFFITPLLLVLFSSLRKEDVGADAIMIDCIVFIIVFAGRLITIWGTVTLNQQKNQLVNSGIFAYTRNPIALGLFISFFGLSLFFNFWFLWLGWLFFVRDIHFKIKIEEQALLLKYPVSYAKYMRQVRRYF